MTMQQGLRKVSVSRNRRTQNPVKRHTRESGHPASVYIHEILSGMDSRFHGNDFLTGQQCVIATFTKDFNVDIEYFELNIFIF
jgi:hypothetical protein